MYVFQTRGGRSVAYYPCPRDRRPTPSGASDGETLVLAPDSVERRVTRYFFDIYDNRTPHIDTDGIEFSDLAAVRAEVQRLLPEIAVAEAVDGADRRSYVVVVRNDAQHTIYSATLTYIGLWHLG